MCSKVHTINLFKIIKNQFINKKAGIIRQSFDLYQFGIRYIFKLSDVRCVFYQTELLQMGGTSAKCGIFYFDT